MFSGLPQWTFPIQFAWTFCERLIIDSSVSFCLGKIEKKKQIRKQRKNITLWYVVTCNLFDMYGKRSFAAGTRCGAVRRAGLAQMVSTPCCGMLNTGFEPHQCWLPRGQQVSHQRWIWGIHCMQVKDPPWLWNPGQTSPEVQNRGINVPTKRTCPPEIKRQRCDAGRLWLKRFLVYAWFLTSVQLKHWRTNTSTCKLYVPWIHKIIGHKWTKIQSNILFEISCQPPSKTCFDIPFGSSFYYLQTSFFLSFTSNVLMTNVLPSQSSHFHTPEILARLIFNW